MRRSACYRLEGGTAFSAVHSACICNSDTLYQQNILKYFLEVLPNLNFVAITAAIISGGHGLLREPDQGVCLFPVIIRA